MSLQDFHLALIYNKLYTNLTEDEFRIIKIIKILYSFLLLDFVKFMIKSFSFIFKCPSEKLKYEKRIWYGPKIPRGRLFHMYFVL